MTTWPRRQCLVQRALQGELQHRGQRRQRYALCRHQPHFVRRGSRNTSRSRADPVNSTAVAVMRASNSSGRVERATASLKASSSIHGAGRQMGHMPPFRGTGAGCPPWGRSHPAAVDSCRSPVRRRAAPGGRRRVIAQDRWEGAARRRRAPRPQRLNPGRPCLGERLARRPEPVLGSCTSGVSANAARQPVSAGLVDVEQAGDELPLRLASSMQHSQGARRVGRIVARV